MKDEQGRRIPPGAAETAFQVAALPYRLDPDLQILLITSRETRRWVLPKGWAMKDRTPAAAAAQEALEEAGLLGEIEETPVGSYRYQKGLKTGESVPCDVSVFPMRVTGQLDAWIEQHQRDFQWVSLEEAAGLVAEPDLGDLIRAFASHPGVRGSSS